MFPLPWVPLPHAVSTVIVPPASEPITLDQAKLAAGLAWPAGDPRDAQMQGFIAAARNHLEQRTGYALLEQTRDVFFDVLCLPVTLPMLCRPLQSVTSIKVTNSQGVQSTVDPANYIVDTVSARIGPAPNGVWPTDLRSFQPWVIRLVAGWATPAAIPPGLVHLVGLLTAHWATFGRDVASIDQATEVPQGFADAISPFLPVEM